MTQNLIVKLLDHTYVEQCVNIRAKNKRDVGGVIFQSHNYTTHLLSDFYLSVKPSWVYRAYGLVNADTNELYSYILMKMLTSQRAWLLRLAISNQNESNGLPMNGLGKVLDAVLDYAESKEYYQYFTLTPSSLTKVHDRAWNAASEKKRGRYIPLLEEIIPPGVVSGYSMYWDDIMGRAVTDYEAAIRRNVLLPEFRTFREATLHD